MEKEKEILLNEKFDIEKRLEDLPNLNIQNKDIEEMILLNKLVEINNKLLSV